MAELTPPEGPFVLTGPATDVEASKLRHSAATFRRQLDALLGQNPGINMLGDLRCTATGSDVNLSVAAGSCFIRGTQAAQQGMYHAVNDATKVIPWLTNNPAHATLDRIDLCVARINDTFYAGGLDNFSIEAVTGTPSGSPVAPAAPANSIILAQILVIHASTVIVVANITDKRGFAGVQRRRVAQIVTTGGQVNADFQFIPPGGTNLSLAYTARDNGAGTTDANLSMQANGDGGANYAGRLLAQVGSTAPVSSEQSGATSAIIGAIANGASTANMVARGIIHFPNYADGFFHSGTYECVEDHIAGLAANVHYRGGWVYRSAAAINRITILATFALGCTFDLFVEP